MWGLAYWWSPVLPIGGRWSFVSPTPDHRRRHVPLTDAQVVGATIDGNSLVLDCVTTSDVVTVRTRLPKHRGRGLRTTVAAWERQAAWIGISLDDDRRTVRVTTEQEVIALELMPG